MTKDDQAYLSTERARYHKDFLYYAPRVLKIRTKAGDIVPFLLNEAQLYAHQQIEKQRATNDQTVRVLILKGRQQGMSTYTEGRFYWLTTLNSGKQAYILTHEDKATANLFGMTNRYHTHAPQWFRPQTDRASSRELRFSKIDSGYLVATAGTKNVGRSSTVQYFHGSEIAFWANADDHMAGLGQTIPSTGSEIILESTANGMGNLFHRMWQEAKRGRSRYIGIFIPWFWQKEYSTDIPLQDPESEDLEYQKAYDLSEGQIAWRRQKIIDDFRGDPAWFDQEYPATEDLAFQRVVGDTLIKSRCVAFARVAKEFDFDIVTAPKILGLDPAEFGDDDTAMIIRQHRRAYALKRIHGYSSMEVVGAVQQHINEDEQLTGRRVDEIRVDATGLGTGVADRLRELGYRVQRVIVGGRPSNEIEYRYLGDEIWGEMAEWLKDDPVEIPDDDVLQSDLTTRTYRRDSSRRLKLTAKEELRRSGIASPDSADALALTFAAKHVADARRNQINHNRRTSQRII